jgi:GT2 family glycosyltransferase
MENEAGSAAEMHVPTAVEDPVAGRKAVLGGVPEAALADDQFLSDHLFPTISRLQERAEGLVKIVRSAEYGRPNESPEVSIVIPLCRRINLVEHQLAQFVHDNELRSAELIYVLDSPEHERALRELAEALFGLYLVSFRILTLERPSGFAGAINSGASDARGRLLLLLNSEVFPDKPGWLGRMRDFYDDASPNMGALGPKLLYEDDSIQHAGLYLELEDEEPTLGALTNRHYFKGLSRDLPAANICRPVPAVSAAGLMVDRNLFESVGGLPDAYMHGDYEGSDLCFRLREKGRENWYLPEVELYHLEAPSYGETEQGMAASYNRWLHTRRWGKLIEGVENDPPVSTGSRPR